MLDSKWEPHNSRRVHAISVVLPYAGRGIVGGGGGGRFLPRVFLAEGVWSSCKRGAVPLSRPSTWREAGDGRMKCESETATCSSSIIVVVVVVVVVAHNACEMSLKR